MIKFSLFISLLISLFIAQTVLGQSRIDGVSFYTNKSSMQYISADESKGNYLIANRNLISTWEQFTILDLNGGQLMSGDKIRIIASNGKFVSEDRDKNNFLIANRQNPGTWENFYIKKTSYQQFVNGEIKSGDLICIQTSTENWITASSSGDHYVFGGAYPLSKGSTFQILFKKKISSSFTCD